MRDAVLLALSLALATGMGGCAVQTVDEDEELVGQHESELSEGDEEEGLDVTIVAVSADPTDRGNAEDPEPEPWEPWGPGAVAGDDPEPEPEDPLTPTSKTNTNTK